MIKEFEVEFLFIFCRDPQKRLRLESEAAPSEHSDEMEGVEKTPQVDIPGVNVVGDNEHGAEHDVVQLAPLRVVLQMEDRLMEAIKEIDRDTLAKIIRHGVNSEFAEVRIFKNSGRAGAETTTGVPRPEENEVTDVAVVEETSRPPEDAELRPPRLLTLPSLEEEEESGTNSVN